MSRRIIETADRLGGLCFKIHLGIPMRIAAVRIEHTMDNELVVFLERIQPEQKAATTLPMCRRVDEEDPRESRVVFGDIRDTKTERLK